MIEARICNILGNVYFKSDLNHGLKLSVCALRANYKKVQAALNICKRKTLPSDPGTVGETLEAVGFPATKEKKIRQTRLEQPRGCVVFFSYFKKINLKSRT